MIENFQSPRKTKKNYCEVAAIIFIATIIYLETFYNRSQCREYPIRQKIIKSFLRGFGHKRESENLGTTLSASLMS